MAADLAKLPLDEPPPPDLDIVPVTDAATLDEFLDIIGADWLDWTDGEHTPVQRRTLDAWRRQIPPKLATEPAPLRWVGRVDGNVVASSRINIGAGVAGLYAISTLPGFRGRGFGRAMTIAALRAARSIGYRIAVLQSSDLGYGVYKRLGFRELFTYDVWVHPGRRRRRILDALTPRGHFVWRTLGGSRENRGRSEEHQCAPGFPPS
jgi:GNAT superfamily N-acetyltransferase